MLLEFCDYNFDSLLGSELTVIDFFSTWCGPCNMLTPVLKSVADKNTDVTIGKLNVVENQEVANRFKVNIVPTIVFFKEGKEVKRVIGFQTEAKLQTLIDGLK